MVGTRVTRLSEQTRRVLCSAALTGRSFTFELLHAATDTIMRRIADQLGELRGEKPPAEFYDMKAAGSTASSMKETA